MEKNLRFVQIAKKVGLSPSTLSSYLNNYTEAPPDLEEKLIKAIEELPAIE